MRFMVLVKGDKSTEDGKLPDPKLFEEMDKFNEELIKAGVMLAAEGLMPTSKGAKIVYSGGKKTVIDGPFAESKELVAGFELWQVKSKAEAIEWLKRAPFQDGEVELRQLYEAADFAPLDPTGEMRAKEEAARATQPGPYRIT